MATVISNDAIARRLYWVEELKKLSGSFGDDSAKMERELTAEIECQGAQALLDHLRLCGDIPEQYDHDSSEEKLYSKYTDALLCEAYKFVGMKSFVLKERGDSSDVEAFANKFSFVADAKAFRLSRTAKNQKDFKVQAMDGWKRGKPHAMVVCPIYQLPTKASQIYEQASARNVCIFTYSHLAVLVNYALVEGNDRAEDLIHQVFKSVEALNPSKDAAAYWGAVNRSMLEFSVSIGNLWKTEKQAAIESIVIAKEEALTFLATQRERIMRMTHEEALRELIEMNKIDAKERVIKAVAHNAILGIV
ncbi:MAG: HindIII family type II restriction endonuclease [Ramlibacter sp.]|nr:HindIII family type II restriction endonuclease [Ramlibacter sp.]